MKQTEPASMRLLSQVIVTVSVIVLLLSGLSMWLFQTRPFAYADHFNATKIATSDTWIPKDKEQKYDPTADLSYYNNLTHYSYVLYYGQFDDSITTSILSAKPTLLITNYYAIDQESRKLFAANNITVIAYLPIAWTHRDIDSTLDEVRRLLDDGADGIFVDEAVTVSNDWELWYHGQIYQLVKDFGKEKIVIINPGTAFINEKSMLVADIICFEHDWRNFADVEWANDYPGWRFMGISSNEFHKVMGYDVDKASARSDLEEARHMNIAYHYSADHYIWLPPWLDIYSGIAGSPHPVSDYSQDLDLDSIEHTRPVSDYPITITETKEFGNKYDSVIEVPKEDDGNEQEQADDNNSGSDSEDEDGDEKEGPPADSGTSTDSNEVTDIAANDTGDTNTSGSKDENNNYSEEHGSESDSTDLNDSNINVIIPNGVNTNVTSSDNDLNAENGSQLAVKDNSILTE
jgi:hypothetical protein